jgi:hypothetical protein
MSGAYLYSRYMSSWHRQGKTLPLYLTFIVGITNICKKIEISPLIDEWLQLGFIFPISYTQPDNVLLKARICAYSWVHTTRKCKLRLIDTVVGFTVLKVHNTKGWITLRLQYNFLHLYCTHICSHCPGANKCKHQGCPFDHFWTLCTIFWPDTLSVYLTTHFIWLVVKPDGG